MPQGNHVTAQQFNILTMTVKDYVDDRLAHNDEARLYYKFNHGAGSVLMGQLLSYPMSDDPSPSERRAIVAMDRALAKDGLRAGLLSDYFFDLALCNKSKAFGVLQGLKPELMP